MIIKEDLIKYFQDACKTKNNLKIGVEHEKFLFNNKSNKRIDFETVSKIFNFLTQFGWKPVKEKNNINPRTCKNLIFFIFFSLSL